MRPRLLLFDIDGTLLHAGGAGRRAISRVFGERFTRRDVFDDVRFHGMTDRAIIRGGLERVGLPADDAAIDAVCVTYVAALAEEMPRSEGFRVCPGVLEVLAAVGGRAGVGVGIGTGNVRAGAEIKLARGALLEHFAFGGFGCDHEDRPTIIRIAAERGAAHLGVARGACRVVVIGDTPRDVAAARAIGAEAIAVATGGIGADELERAGATRVFPDLTAPGVVDALLGA